MFPQAFLVNYVVSKKSLLSLKITEVTTATKMLTSDNYSPPKIIFQPTMVQKVTNTYSLQSLFWQQQQKEHTTHHGKIHFTPRGLFHWKDRSLLIKVNSRDNDCGKCRSVWKTIIYPRTRKSNFGPLTEEITKHTLWQSGKRKKT